MDKVPNPIRKGPHVWIPPFPPHCDQWVGPYEDIHEARMDREGMERTINSPDWKMMMVEKEDEFDEQWEQYEAEMKAEKEQQ